LDKAHETAGRSIIQAFIFLFELDLHDLHRIREAHLRALDAESGYIHPGLRRLGARQNHYGAPAREQVDFRQVRRLIVACEVAFGMKGQAHILDLAESDRDAYLDKKLRALAAEEDHLFAAKRPQLNGQQLCTS
jgi:hypothetical protein